MAGRKTKEFQDYLYDGGDSHIDQDEYLENPATAFLKYCVEAKSAVDLCSRHFPKKTSGDYNKAAVDSLEHLVSAMHPCNHGALRNFSTTFVRRCF